MSKRDLITKDYALYVVHYFASMQTWSKKDIIAEIDRTIKEAKEDVVRCKDCQFYEEVEYYPDCGIKCVCRLLKRQMDENDFCSYGERKE